MRSFCGEEGAFEVRKAVAVLAQGDLLGILNQENHHHLLDGNKRRSPRKPCPSHQCCFSTCSWHHFLCLDVELCLHGHNSHRCVCFPIPPALTGTFPFGCQHVGFPTRLVSILQFARRCVLKSLGLQRACRRKAARPRVEEVPAMGTCNCLCISGKKC